MLRDREKFDRFITMSVLLHAGLAAVVLFSSSMFSMNGGAWGTETSTGDGMSVNLVGSVSGIPLPVPAVVTPDAAANPSPGFSNTEPATPEPPPEDAEPVPDTTAPVRTTPPPRPARPAPRPNNDEAPPPPDNTVPFGQGGRPALTYGQYQTGAGTAGVGFGDGAFGDRYGWYVQAMIRRVSQNWLQSMVDRNLRTAPRVYLEFDIARDGSISNIEIKQSSGIPNLDRSAERAIRASNPLGQLPGDYRGSSITVSFYFEYVR